MEISKFEKYRYKLLLAFIILFLTIPAFITTGIYQIITLISLSFIFIQSIWIFTRTKLQAYLATISVMIILTLSWFSALLSDSTATEIARLILYIVFFSFILYALFQVIIRSKKVSVDLIVISIAIYMIIGIIGGSFAFLFYFLYPETAFNLPGTIQHSDLIDFTYFSFVTMSTLGYGDITPIRQETQALSYFLAIIGQFYMAIIVATLVSKYISRDPD